jgi:hypothetical protein
MEIYEIEEVEMLAVTDEALEQSVVGVQLMTACGFGNTCSYWMED